MRVAPSKAKSKATPFQSLSESEQERVISEIVNGNDRTLANKARFLSLRDEYFAQAMIAHGVDAKDFDNHEVELQDDVKPAASFFDPHWLVGLDLLDPYSKRMLQRVYKPRQIGLVTNGRTADPSAFDGAEVGWLPFDPETLDGGMLKVFRPRLGFAQSWGSGPNQIYGTVVVSHYRKKHGITWLAVRRVIPGSDPAVNPSGLASTIYELMLRNIRWVPMIVASYDPLGEYLVAPQSASDQPEETIRVHVNDNGRYREDVYTATTVDGWQRLIGSLSPGIEPDPEEAVTLSMTPIEAKRRYFQLVMAVHMAAATDTNFNERITAGSGMQVLLRQKLPVGDAQLEYLPAYDSGDVALTKQQQSLNRARPFTF